MILPGETFVEVNSKIFNCLSLRDVCMVYLHLGGEHWTCLRANDMWDDLESFIFGFHFRVQVMISSRCTWRLRRSVWGLNLLWKWLYHQRRCWGLFCLIKGDLLCITCTGMAPVCCFEELPKALGVRTMFCCWVKLRSTCRYGRILVCLGILLVEFV